MFRILLFIVVINYPCISVLAQFLDTFDGELEGWTCRTGDGEATIDFQPGEGQASIRVDATQDHRNIWWAIIRHEATGLNLKRLTRPGYELRIETRVKVSHAPRRMNLHLNTQRTTDFHSHLMEYDIPDTANWHTISMTTKDFDGQPGDIIGAQMALMDWGRGKYRVDVDYFKVDVVDTKTIGPDKGTQLPYRPPIPDPTVFEHHLNVSEDAVIDSDYPDLNLQPWKVIQKGNEHDVLAVNSSQMSILRWNFEALKEQKAQGAGLLELTVYSVQKAPKYQKDFGMVRITEILAGDPNWKDDKVTMENFCQGQTLEDVLNTQMIIDTDITEFKDSRALFTISQPVLQRLIDGKTLGLAVRPLGAVNVSFFSSEEAEGQFCPKLHLQVE